MKDKGNGGGKIRRKRTVWPTKNTNLGEGKKKKSMTTRCGTGQE